MGFCSTNPSSLRTGIATSRSCPAPMSLLHDAHHTGDFILMFPGSQQARGKCKMRKHSSVSNQHYFLASPGITSSYVTLFKIVAIWLCLLIIDTMQRFSKATSDFRAKLQVSYQPISPHGCELLLWNGWNQSNRKPGIHTCSYF